jgi:ubiquitin-small subunit ribosomal protein S27Ae
MADKKKIKKKKTSQKWTSYKIAGGKIASKNKFCPKCGQGVFLAEHKDRWTCGNCSYMEKKVK